MTPGVKKSYKSIIFRRQFRMLQEAGAALSRIEASEFDAGCDSVL